jgi:hypothetical protein
MGHASAVETAEKFVGRLRAAQEIALSLVGLDGPEAIDLAVRAGYKRSQVITPDVQALTTDLDSFRIRLFVDDLGVVVRASAG